MELIIVRHGEAELAFNDDNRHLTENGKEEVESVGRFLSSIGAQPEYIFHSNKARSIESAMRISKTYGNNVKLELEKGIGPEGDIFNIIDILTLAKYCAVIVGHIPFIERLTSYLLFQDPQRNLFDFDTGSVVCLKNIREVDFERVANGWRIEWFLKPIEIGV